MGVTRQTPPHTGLLTVTTVTALKTNGYSRSQLLQMTGLCNSYRPDFPSENNPVTVVTVRKGVRGVWRAKGPFFALLTRRNLKVIEGTGPTRGIASDTTGRKHEGETT